LPLDDGQLAGSENVFQQTS
jgi:hypothetical protein